MRWLWLLIFIPQIVFGAVRQDTIKGAPGTLGVRDTYINFNAQNTNYSTATILWARGDYPTTQPYKILIAPVGFKYLTDSLAALGYTTVDSTVLSIYDSLYSTSGSGDAGAWTIFRRLAKPQKFAWATWAKWEDSTSTPNDSDWTSSGAGSDAGSENNQSGAGGDMLGSNLITVPTAMNSGRQTFNITSLGALWKAGTATERGLIMCFGDGYEYGVEYPLPTVTANSKDSVGVCSTECATDSKRPMFIIYSRTSSSPARRRRTMTFGDNAAQEWREKYCWRYEQ